MYVIIIVTVRFITDSPFHRANESLLKTLNQTQVYVNPMLELKEYSDSDELKSIIYLNGSQSNQLVQKSTVGHTPSSTSCSEGGGG